MKRFLSLSLALIMSLGMAVNTFAANFSDINNVPWEGAKQYINDVADKGIMVGDTDSSGKKVFRAKDRVTYCEAMQLAYSVLKMTDGLKTTADTSVKWSSTMQEANIPTWAFPAVSYGLESGVVSANDIKIFMKGAGVNRDATRENVAVIFGKALSHIAVIDKSAKLSFNDSSQITSTSVPYIELLARLNIFMGDEKQNFNPKNYINRAEMAVIVSKTYDKVGEIKKDAPAIAPESGVLSINGTVILTDDGTTSKNIAVSNTDTGVITTYTVNENTPVIALDGEGKSYEDISLGDEIIITTSNGIVVSIVMKEDKIEEKKETETSAYKGYLNNISEYVVVFDAENGNQERYEMASNPRVTLNGGMTTISDLYDYVIDRNIIYVEVSVNAQGYAEDISAKFPDIEGELVNVKNDMVYVEFNYAGKTKTVKLEITNGCELYLDDEKISESKLERMFEEDEAKGLYAYVKVDKFNEAEEVEIFHDTYSQGDLVSISSGDIVIMSKFEKEFEYEFADEAEFYLNGGKSTYKKIRNALKEGDVIVTLEFDEDDLVSKVSAQSTSISGKLKSADHKRIVIIDDDNTRISVPVDRNIETEYNGKDVSLAQFVENVEDAEFDIVAKAKLDKNGNVIFVEAVEGSDSEGVIVEIGSTEITIEDVAGLQYSYKIEPAVKYYYNDDEIHDFSMMLEYARDKDSTIKLTFSSRGFVNRIYIYNED